MKVTDKIQITNEDNMELMARYPDKYFDLAIVDPPYGIGVTKNKRLNNNSNNDWDNEIPNKKYFDELLGLVNFFIQYEPTKDYIDIQILHSNLSKFL